MNPDLPQETLDLLILKVVALAPLHGYGIAERLNQVSRGVVQVPQGSLYPALHRLENRGLLAADWEQIGTGQEARLYRLTRKGAGAARKRSGVLAATYRGIQTDSQNFPRRIQPGILALFDFLPLARAGGKCSSPKFKNLFISFIHRARQCVDGDR